MGDYLRWADYTLKIIGAVIYKSILKAFIKMALSFTLTQQSIRLKKIK